MNIVRPVRGLLLAGLVVLSLPSCSAPRGGDEPEAQSSGTAAVQGRGGDCVDPAAYYAAAPETAIWTEGGKLTNKGKELTAALGRSSESGIEPVLLPGNSELELAGAFVELARRLSAAPVDARMQYVDEALRPRAPCPSDLLDAAAKLPSLQPLLQQMQAPNLLAERLLQASRSETDPETRRTLASDLALARSLGQLRRAIVVDAEAARLWTIDGGDVAATMKVIVGKSGSETPPMAALLRFALVNPHWDIPPDLVSRDIAPQVIGGGQAFLDRRDYQVVHAYGPAPQPLDAAAVDWKAVQDGAQSVGVRQRPGPTNTMGRVLFMFPNELGIYLHDTPGRHNFARADRRLSNGCVRVERAAELYRWAFGHDLPGRSIGADQRVDIAEPLPVFLMTFSPAGAHALAGLTKPEPSSSAVG